MKVLELEVLSIDDKRVFFKIKHQNTTILKRGRFSRIMSNGFKIVSSVYPDASCVAEEFFIQGIGKSDDNRKLNCQHRRFDKIIDAVNELNDMYKYEEVYDE